MDRLRLAGSAVAATLLLTAGVLAFAGGDHGSEPPLAIGSEPRLVSTAELAELEGALGHPVYWVGERSGNALELSREADGSIYLRYLAHGSEAADPRQSHLTVGTYPVADAVGALERTAREGDSTVRRLQSGAVLLANQDSGSAYLAYPGEDLQIEVYDPAPGKALKLIEAGAVGPVSR